MVLVRRTNATPPALAALLATGWLFAPATPSAAEVTAAVPTGAAEGADVATPVAPPPRFDPAAMPEVAPPDLPLGYRHGDLSLAEVAALRRSFKLPLDALAGARSARDLAATGVEAPLPNPHVPLLRASATPSTGANPFIDSATISFRENPLRALGEMLALVEGEKPRAPDRAKTAADDDPFGGVDAAADPTATDSAAAAEVDQGADPFGGGEDPFAPAPEEGLDDAAPAADESDDPFAF